MKNLTLQEKLEFFKEKGWTYDAETGNIYSHKNALITGKHTTGYLQCNVYYYKKLINVYAHQLAYYLYTGKVPTTIDHINQCITDNRICNLREVTKQENTFNSKSKGYSYDKHAKKYKAYIKINNKLIHLGYYECEQDARQAYLNGKKIHHVIKCSN